MGFKLSASRFMPGWGLLLVVMSFCSYHDQAWAQGIATSNVQAEQRSTLSGRPFPVSFVDVAREAGLQMTFTSGNETKKKYIIEVNGSGVGLIDYDDDGWLDAFLVNGSRLEGFNGDKEPTSRLFRNLGDGTFKDVTEEAQVGRAGWGAGVCAGDMDNDGHVDLFVTYWGHNVLYRNTGTGSFSDETEKAGVAGPVKEWSSGCTFIDYDRDGYLDLFVTSYQGFDLATAAVPGTGANCEWKGMPVFCGPRGLPFGTATLFRNRGDGTFQDVSEQSGIRDVKDYYAFTAVAADFNQDGWVDIYVACDSTPSIFFRNNGDGTFTDIGMETGLAFNEHGFEQGGMGISVGDIDRDGSLDVIKTNFADDHPNVYQNVDNGFFEDIAFRAGLAVNPQFVGWGVALVDLDNDGWQDIFQVNGHVYPALDRQHRINERYRQPHVVYRNLGNARFEDVSVLAGPAIGDMASSRGAAFGDFDNDGDIDVLIMNMGADVSLLRNDLTSDNHWIQVQLRGTTSNRSAIGATVTLHASDLVLTSTVLSQSSYLSQNDFRLHFGLGQEERIDKFIVVWPSGEREEFPGTSSNQRHLLVEGTGVSKAVSASQ